MNGNTEVIVIGGGYAGVMAANRLTQRDDVTVTLINPRPDFVERIRLHQLVAGTHHATVDLRDVLAPRVRLVVDAVTGIDAAGRRLTLAGGGTAGYDYLIYAVGSGSSGTAAGDAYPIATLEEAQRLHTALAATAPHAPVTVVGGGPTGIETAAELAGLGRPVTLVCGGEVGPYLHPKGRRSVTARLARLGVTVLDSTATAVSAGVVRLGDGRELPSAVTIWAAGFGVPDLAARSGLSTDVLGRLRTDETLTSVDDDHVVAAGDSAAPSDRPFRMSCQAAGPLALAAADTVLARIAGRTPQPVKIAFAGQCLSLGRHDGFFQFARRNDTAVGAHLAGRAAAGLKEFVCRGTVAQLKMEARRPGMIRIPAMIADKERAWIPA